MSMLRVNSRPVLVRLLLWLAVQSLPFLVALLAAQGVDLYRLHDAACLLLASVH